MKLLLTAFLCMILSIANADPLNFSGNKTVIPGAIETYTITWSNPIALHNANSVYWNVTGGSILSHSSTEITIEWGYPPAWENGTGIIDVSEEFGSQSGTGTVSIINFTEGVLEECSNILGPAAVFVDFGAGANPGPPLPAGSITYPYNPSCAVFSGEYTRTNTTVNCRSAWLQIPQDHTPGDINGYMLLIDGDNNSGEVYRATATGLTDAFQYEFSAYLANLTYPSGSYERPRLQFEIYDLNNNLIQSSGSFPVEYDAGNPWQKLSFMFNLPSGISSVQVVLRNKNNKEDGNDFVVDDLSFAPCYPPILASFSNSNIVTKSYTCNSGNVNLFYKWPTATIPFTNPSFRWQRNNNNPSVWLDISGGTTQNFQITESAGGIYKYRVIAYETSNPSLAVISNEITYFVQKMIVDAKPYNVVNCIPAPFTLIPSYRLQYSDPGAPSAYTFLWSPGTYLNSSTIETPIISLPALPPPPSINSPNAAPPVIRTYNLTVNNTTYSGCIASNVQTVAQHNPRKVAIPNAFTPNGDGNNDFFRPLNIQDYPGSVFRIWNRWGNQTFYSQGPTLANYSWNGFYGGQLAEQGVYTWSVDIKGNGCATNILNSAGSSQSNNPYGNVTLIR